MGGLAILQGLQNTPADEKNLHATHSSDGPGTNADVPSVLIPVASIAGSESQIPADRLEGTRYDNPSGPPVYAQPEHDPFQSGSVHQSGSVQIENGSTTQDYQNAPSRYASIIAEEVPASSQVTDNPHSLTRLSDSARTDSLARNAGNAVFPEGQFQEATLPLDSNEVHPVSTTTIGEDETVDLGPDAIEVPEADFQLSESVVSPSSPTSTIRPNRLRRNLTTPTPGEIQQLNPENAATDFASEVEASISDNDLDSLVDLPRNSVDEPSGESVVTSPRAIELPVQESFELAPVTNQADTRSRYASTGSQDSYESFETRTEEEAHGSLPADVLHSTATELAAKNFTSSQTPDGSATHNFSPDDFQILSQPGDPTLEGQQKPEIIVEKTAPPEIQIGKPAEFRLILRNVGKVPAHQVIVTDQVPRGTRLISTEPQTSATEGNALFWDVDTLNSGEQFVATVQVMPEAEGEIGSVAAVSFQTSASARTVSTRPLLEIEHTASERVHIGEQVILKIRVSNPGSGHATSVVLEENVPQGFSHPAGTALERELGTIKRGESRDVELTLIADKAGLVENVIVARADANLSAEHRIQLEVIAPELQVSVVGPAKRYLERQAKYTLSVANQGTATAKNIELVAHLPNGMKFLETNNAGQYDPRTHAVYWSLEELHAKQIGDVQLTTLPVETGEQKFRFEGNAELGLTDSLERSVMVDGLASLFFEVADTADPIEVGNDTTYEIHLVNEGSKAATGIIVQAILPQGMKAIDASGPTNFEIADQQVHFQTLQQLAPGADHIYQIQVKGIAPGDQRIKVMVKDSKMQSAISEEEGTLVYSDN
jgi:uncharacterized repeat protein (TIGR01451 family)